MSRGSHLDMQGRIDRHFVGRISAADERTLRAHLPGCEDCTRYYERHLLLADLDPSAPSEADRLAIGLGLRARRWRPWSVGLALAGAAAMVAVGVMFLVAHAPEPTYSSRGARSEPVTLLVYRATQGRSVALVGSAIRPDDELAFAYRNAAGKKNLALFGVGADGSVYWYYPAWRHSGENPRAVPILAGDQLRELPEAVRHAIRGERLTLVGLFSDEALSVRDIEARLRRAPGAIEISVPGTIRVTRSLKVTRGGGPQ